MDVKVEFRAGCDERKVHQELVSAARTADMPQPADASVTRLTRRAKSTLRPCPHPYRLEVEQSLILELI